MDNERFLLKVKLQKHQQMKFFSQLDLVRVLGRALRRTDLPIYFTKGFNPHVKLSFGDALKLGQEGIVDITFYFTAKIPVDEFKDKLIPQLPRGLSIVEIGEK